MRPPPHPVSIHISQYPGYCFELCVKCDETCSRCLNLEKTHGAVDAHYGPAMRPLCTHALIFDRVAAQVIVNNFYPVKDAYDNFITDTACRFDLKVRLVYSSTYLSAWTT